MKTLFLPAVMLAMTALLTACPGAGGDNPPPADGYALTVNVTGAGTAPVKVTNTVSDAVLWNDSIAGAKTFTGLTAGNLIRVEGSAVNGYSTPATQMVMMDASKTVILAYTSVARIPAATTITGKVTGNTLKIGDAYLGSNRTPFFIKGSVDSSNILTMNLATITPGNSDWFADIYGRCQGTNSNPQALVYPGLSMGAYSPQGEYIGEIIEVAVAGMGAGTGQTFVFRMYSSADWTFKGSCPYTDGAGKQVIEDIDISVKKGWTLLMTTISTSGLNQTTRNIAGDVRTELRFIQADPYVAVQLTPPNLVFTADAPVTVDAEFLQIGGYSGLVTLSTDRPGLIVEPATLTLPSLPAMTAQSVSHRLNLAAQLLQPQAITTKLTFKYTGTDNYTGPFTLKVTDASGKIVGNGNGSLNVQRPGLTLSASGYNLQLDANSTLDIPVCAYGVGGFAGEVTFSAQNLPAGVSVTPTKVTFNGSACAQVKLTSGAGVKAGIYSISLTASGSGVSAQTPVDITILSPSIGVSFLSDRAVVYQGSSGSITVDVNSLYGFSGSTTLTLSGLPAGITAEARTVTVAPNTTTRAMLTLQVAATAPLGDAQIKLNSPDLASTSSVSATLSVRPARIAIPTGDSTVRASTGVWQITSTNTSDPAPGSYTSTITRSGIDGSTLATKVSGYIDRLLPTSDGVLALSLNYSSAAGGHLIKHDGTATPLKSVGLVYGDILSPGTDALGRVWFLRNSYSNGVTSTQLSTWDPATGAVNAVQTGSTQYSYDGRLVLSADGTALLYIQSYNGTILKIATATGVVTPVPGTGGYSSAAVGNDGTVWFSGYSSLTRVNADGTLTIYNTLNTSQLIGFDTDNPSVLWGMDYGSTVNRIDTATATVKSFPLSGGMSPRATTAPGGGLYVVFYEYQSNGTNLPYLSLLK